MDNISAPTVRVQEQRSHEKNPDEDTDSEQRDRVGRRHAAHAVALGDAAQTLAHLLEARPLASLLRVRRLRHRVCSYRRCRLGLRLHALDAAHEAKHDHPPFLRTALSAASRPFSASSAPSRR